MPFKKRTHRNARDLLGAQSKLPVRVHRGTPEDVKQRECENLHGLPIFGSVIPAAGELDDVDGSERDVVHCGRVDRSTPKTPPFFFIGELRANRR